MWADVPNLTFTTMVGRGSRWPKLREAAGGSPLRRLVRFGQALEEFLELLEGSSRDGKRLGLIPKGSQHLNLVLVAAIFRQREEGGIVGAGKLDGEDGGGLLQVAGVFQ